MHKSYDFYVNLDEETDKMTGKINYLEIKLFQLK
jgi:hypothetical protein